MFTRNSRNTHNNKLNRSQKDNFRVSSTLAVLDSDQFPCLIFRIIMNNNCLSDDDDSLVTHTLTQNEALVHGLLLPDYSQAQIDKCRDETNQSRFNCKYGASPAVVCTIYEDLQKSSAENRSVVPHRSMHLEGSIPNFNWLLCSMMYLQKYPFEDKFETHFHLTAQYACSHI